MLGNIAGAAPVVRRIDSAAHFTHGFCGSRRVASMKLLRAMLIFTH